MEVSRAEAAFTADGTEYPAGTLVVMMDFADRDALIEEDPRTYYLKEHYVAYPCVLVRLARVHPDALRDLVVGAHGYVSGKSRKKSAVLATFKTSKVRRS